MPASCCRARRQEGVAYLPGTVFRGGALEPGALRLSFAGLAPDEIRKGHRRFWGDILAERIGQSARKFGARAGNGLDSSS